MASLIEKVEKFNFKIFQERFMDAMRLLIVEDHLQTRRLIRSFIQDLADEVYECADGSSAPNLYQTLQPDWVLMDLQMPGSDGISAARQIIGQHPQAKIIIVTNFDENEMRTAAAEAGASSYILKSDLMQLRKMLDQKG